MRLNVSGKFVSSYDPSGDAISSGNIYSKYKAACPSEPPAHAIHQLVRARTAPSATTVLPQNANTRNYTSIRRKKNNNEFEIFSSMLKIYPSVMLIRIICFSPSSSALGSPGHKAYKGSSRRHLCPGWQRARLTGLAIDGS